MSAVPVDRARDPRIVWARPAQSVANSCPRVDIARGGFVRLRVRQNPCRISQGHSDDGRIERCRRTVVDCRALAAPVLVLHVMRVSTRVLPRRLGDGDVGMRARTGVRRLRLYGASRQHGGYRKDRAWQPRTPPGWLPACRERSSGGRRAIGRAGSGRHKVVIRLWWGP